MRAGDDDDQQTDRDLVCVYTTSDAQEAQLARGTLESAGMRVTLTGDTLQTSTFGGVSFRETPLKIFVAAADAERARDALAALEVDEADAEPWICVHCGTMVEGVFAICWRCGHEER